MLTLISQPKLGVCRVADMKLNDTMKMALIIGTLLALALLILLIPATSPALTLAR